MPTKRAAVKERLDLKALRQEVREWYALKRQDALLTPKLKKGTDRFKELLAKYGDKDPTDGSIYLDLEEPIGDQNIRYLKNLCVVSKNQINDEVAEEILRGKDIWEELSDPVRVPNEERIRAAYYDNRISDDELARMFPAVTSYRFFLLDEDEKPVRA
jgi:hypothetical protein